VTEFNKIILLDTYKHEKIHMISSIMTAIFVKVTKQK
jgi:hypothetical protein